MEDDVEYGIQFEYDGEIYQSSLSKPLYTPEINSVSWTQPEEEGQVFFHVSTHDFTEGAKYFVWNYVEDWEFKLAEDVTYCWKNNKSNTYLIGSTEKLSENRIINKQLYQHNSEDKRFERLYSVIVTQKAISRGVLMNFIKM